MDLFFIHQEKRNEEKIRDYFLWFSGCGIMNIHNNKLVDDALNKLRETHTF
jgi:hypothetical protein